MQRVSGTLFLLLSLSFYLLGGVTLVATLRVFTLDSTLAAIEAAVGSGVITLFLLAAGRRSWRAGRARLSPHNHADAANRHP